MRQSPQPLQEPPGTTEVNRYPAAAAAAAAGKQYRRRVHDPMNHCVGRQRIMFTVDLTEHSKACRTRRVDEPNRTKSSAPRRAAPQSAAQQRTAPRSKSHCDGQFR